MLFLLRRATMTANGFRLGEGGELEVQMFNLAQMLIRIPNVQILYKSPTFAKPLLAVVYFLFTFDVLLIFNCSCTLIPKIEQTCCFVL